MIEHALRMLLLQTLALSVATCVVRLLQASVLRRLGAAASYLAWLLVPVAMLATALPHPAGDALAIHVDVGAIAPSWAAAAPASMEAATPVWVIVAMAAWAAGAALLALVLWRRQHGFEALVKASCLPAGAGPAVLGVWRRRIVLPRDFDSAFDAEERRLMLLHEGVHLRRADNAWNLLATALLVLHWFNPVAWWAWRGLRADQELACDAEVLRHEEPGALAIYANALLKVQGVALTPPLATSWQSTHPLVERIRMLQQHRITPVRLRAGGRLAVLATVLAAIGGYSVRSSADAPAANAVSIMTALEIKRVYPGGNSTISAKLLTREGQRAVVRFDAPEVVQHVLMAPVEIALTVKRLDAGQLQIDTTLSRGNPLLVLSSPRVITIDGTPARIEVMSGDGRDDLVLTLVPKVLEGSPVLTPETNDVRKS